jgi:hypothetical protein
MSSTTKRLWQVPWEKKARCRGFYSIYLQLAPCNQALVGQQQAGTARVVIEKVCTRQVSDFHPQRAFFGRLARRRNRWRFVGFAVS